jgi:shikimate dehydrogenase
MAKARNTRDAIEGTTRIVGVFGDPVAHSLSPRMHNAAYRELGLDYAYVPFPVDGKRIRDAVRSVLSLGLAGVNVTVPFKEAVMKHVDRVTPIARAIGAVNTIYPDRGKLVGENTDGAGFTAALAAGGMRCRGKRVLLIGAGGAARAVAHALLLGGASDIVIANRTRAKAMKIRKALPRHRAELHVADLEVLDDFDFLASRQLVVNSTSVGLKGGKFLDYAVEATPKGCMHFDLAYGEKPTAFLAAAAAEGRPTTDGRAMLVHQGAIAFKLFTGRKAPIDVMNRAVGLRG